MSHFFTPDQLNLVFGSTSTGDTPDDRAKNSSVNFVRSQIQLAPYSSGATGRVLSSQEALNTFGWEILYQASVEGSAPLISSPKEPAATLRSRRQELGLTKDALAKKIKISKDTIERAETEGIKNPYRTLELLAQALALDEQSLGVVPNSGRDMGLGVRLREMAASGDITGFTAATVLQLTEAAWIIKRQVDLQAQLENEIAPSTVRMPKHDPSFGYPAYETGYRLAKKTRDLLGLTSEEPIVSVRKIIEERFRIPLVQLQMDSRFAGATVTNGAARGIVVNEFGMNSNVWVRRMTMCHELGHLLWDPDNRLQNVIVDKYAELEMIDQNVRRDPAEIRANAFAIAFLAPPEAIKKISDRTSNSIELLREVVTTFGVSATAAKHHIKNIIKLDISSTQQINLLEPDRSLVAGENFALDFFPIQSTPISRRGKFAWCVAKAVEGGQASLDSAASWLAAPAQDVSVEALRKILSLHGSTD